jgi:hypothetical protein
MKNDNLEFGAAAVIPAARPAGISGMLAGLLLVGELTAFMASGWSAATFGNPS